VPPRRLLAGLSLAFAAAFALHVVAADTAASRLREIFDAAHVLGFTCLAAVTLLVARRLGLGPRPALVLSAAIVAAFAVVAESAQLLTARDASIGDLGRDAAGLCAGLALVCAAGAPAMRWRLAGIAVLALAAGLFAPGRILVARGLALRSLPVLAGFERSLEAPFFSGSNASVERVPAPAGWPLGGQVARVTPAPGSRYPGIAFFDLPRDWRGYEALSFVVAAESGALRELSIRIHDTVHDNTFADRFNRVFAVGSAPERIRIELADVRAAPRGRPLDLARVEEIIVFAVGSAHGGFLIDDLRLE